MIPLTNSKLLLLSPQTHGLGTANGPTDCSDGRSWRCRTCVLREAGAVAVALGDGDAVLGAHCPPVRGERPRWRGRLALGEGPLAGVPVAGAVRRLDTLP